MQTKTLIFGHRGYPKVYPENSLAGFSYALAQGVDGLEFDVHLTKDQIPVIMHDEQIDRTTNGVGLIQQYTLAELQHFCLANHEPIPTLAALLQLVGQRPVQLNLEFKTDQIQYPGIEAIVLAMVATAELTRPVIFSSFHLPTLKTCQAIDANQLYYWLTEAKLTNPSDFIQQEKLDGLHLKHYQAEAGQNQRVWTVNQVELAAELFQRQVAGIFTDDFVQMTDLRNQLVTN